MSEFKARITVEAEGGEKAAKSLRDVEAAQKKLTETTLNSSEATREVKAEARAVVLAFDEQTAAERRAQGAAEAMAVALRELREIEGQLSQARKSGTVGQVGALSEKMDVARRKARDLGVEEEKLRAGEGDYLDILRRVNPALGELADVMIKGSKVAGDLASKNIDLSDIMGKIPGLVKANISSFLLLGAGGAAILAILAVVKVWRDLEGQIKRTREEQIRFNDEQTRAKEAELGIEDATNKVIDRQRESRTVAERRQAFGVAGRLTDRGVDEGTAAQVAGTFAGAGLGEGGLNLDQLQIIARAVESGRLDLGDIGGAGDDRALSRAQRFLGSKAGTRAAENVAAGRGLASIRAERAGRQLGSGFAPSGASSILAGALFGDAKLPAGAADVIGQSAELQRLIEETFGPQEDIERTTKLLQQFSFAKEQGLKGRDFGRFLIGASEDLFGEEGVVDTTEVIKLRNMLQQLEAQIERLQKPAPTTVTQHFYNAKVDTNKGISRNGQSHRELNSPEG